MGDTGDGGGANVDLFGYLEIWDTLIKQLGNLPALADLFDFLDSHDVAEKIG